MDYASLKGRARQPMSLFPASPEEAKTHTAPLKPLNEAARTLAAEKRSLHRDLLQEYEPFFKDLYALGMVPGWRAIERVTIKETGR